jgi:hypothetical protein
MKPLRKLLIFVIGILALVDLVGVFLDVLLLHWRSIPWALLKTAFWAACCVTLIIVDRRGIAPAPEKP